MISNSLLIRTDADYKDSARWYVNVRWLFLTSIIVPGILSNYLGEGLSPQVRRDIALGLLALGSNALLLFLVRKNDGQAYYKTLASVTLLIDLLIITLLIFTKGGVESRSPILYTIPILISSAIFGKVGVYYATGLSIILYDTLITLDWLNIITSINAVNPTLRTDGTYTLNTIVFFTSSLIIIGILADFITRLLAQKQEIARASASALEEAQKLAKVGSWSWDIKADQITWSKQMYSMFNLDRKTFKATFKSYLSALHPDDKEQVEKYIQNARKTGATFRFSHRILINNEVTWLQANGQVVLGPNGNAIRMYGTAQDITEQKKLDDAKEEFIAIASHQLRTPATAVKNFIGLLQQGYAGELNKEQKEYIQHAYESNERQLTLINRLLYVARSDSGEIVLNKELSNVGSLIEDVIAEHTPEIGDRKQSLEFKAPNDTTLAMIDHTYFKMAFSNLLSNASKYTKDGGKIEVQLKKTRKCMTLSVSDSGVGIAKRDFPRLFERFSRIENELSPKIDGSGLGLYVAKKIVELHGATINVQSRRGEGTTFSIRIPLEHPQQTPRT